MKKIVFILLSSVLFSGCGSRLARIESKIDYCMEKYCETYEDMTEEEIEKARAFGGNGLSYSRILPTRPLIEGWKERYEK